MLKPGENRDESLDGLLRTCIDTPSHSGQEGPLLDKIQSAIETSGTDAKILRGPWGMAIVWPARDGIKNGLRLLDGHIDHVSADAKDWTSDPFKTRAEEVDSDIRYYGRGSVDQIGGVVTALQACVEVAQRVPPQRRDRPFGVILSAAEELAEGWGPQCAVDALNKSGWTVNEVVITEPSQGDVMTAQMGRGRYRIESKHPYVLVALALILEETYDRVAEITNEKQALTLLCGNFKSGCDATIDSQIPSRAVVVFEISRDISSDRLDHVDTQIRQMMDRFMMDKNFAESIEIARAAKIWTITVIGKTAHSAFKEQGKNAGIALATIMNEVSRRVPELNFVNGTIGDGSLDGISWEKGQLFYDHRLDIYENPDGPDGILEMIRARIKDLSDGFGVSSNDTTVELHTQTICVDKGRKEVPVPQFFPAWETNGMSRLYDDMMVAVQKVVGHIREGVWGFCTGGSGYAQKGISLIGIGPGDQTLAHMVDEFVPFSQVKNVTAILFELIMRHVGYREDDRKSALSSKASHSLT